MAVTTGTGTRADVPGNGASPGQLDSSIRRPASSSARFRRSLPIRCSRSWTTSPASSRSGRNCRWRTARAICGARRRCCSISSDEIAELISREQGKPRLESFTMELLPTIDALHWCADNGPRILGDEPIPTPQLMLKQKKSKFVYEPIGVVGVIAPWNYPWSIPFGEVAIALMAGNGVVLKPASLTPLIGQRIQDVFERAGFPEGLIRTVHGGGAVGQALVESSAGRSSSRDRRGGPRGRRGVRPAAEGLRARAGREGPADRVLGRATCACGLGSRVGRILECGADLLGHRAHIRDARCGRPLHRGCGARGEPAASRQPARLADRDRPDGVEGAVRPRDGAGGRRGRGGRRG